MTDNNPPSLILQAVDALRQFDRRGAVALIKEDMRRNSAPGDRWRSIAKLCGTIGEIELEIEASRRYAAAEPRTLDRVLQYCSALATRGRFAECLKTIGAFPENIREHTAVVHLRATLAAQMGEFDLAQRLDRKTIKDAPLTGQNWLSLSMIKKFAPDDPDIAAMESLRPQLQQTPEISRAAFFYALGKAYHDSENYDGAFAAYSEGAAIKRRLEPYDRKARDTLTRTIIEQYTPEAFSRLKLSRCENNRAIFVTGLPRSGTTLIEQILTSHTAVSDGAEINLFRAALIPAGDFSFGGAMAYQSRSDSGDPWGDVAGDYCDMLAARFGTNGRIVDKTLNHSHFLGLILHSLPRAKVVWLRRDPADTAISVFRNYFALQVPWSYSFEDIAHYFRCDDALHAHWMRLFPDRILTVPYEELVTRPRDWTSRMLAHLDMPDEPAAYEPHKQKSRTVLTASVAQVREAISTKQVGAAKAYDKFMSPFRDAYYL